jgi:DNA-binding NarL/FixJ family response regulator
MTMRVVIADDQALLRGGFRALLEPAPDLEVVAEAGDGAEAVEAARQHRADEVLMDIRMPRVDGLEATRRISADPGLSSVKVLIVTTFESDEYVYEALRAGASGFLLKDTEPADLILAVRVVARGDALLSPSVTRRLVEDIAGKRGGRRPRLPANLLEPLTEREREVLSLVAQGLTNDDRSQAVHELPDGQTHVSRTMSKLGARDRAQLVVIAYETGLVVLGGAV